jgi:outer membrane protein
MNCINGLTRRRISLRGWRGGAVAAIICAALSAPAANAETLGGALAKAYLSNPDINQQRAAVRVQDENIPKANAGYLPTVSAEADAGVENFQATGEGAAAGVASTFEQTSRPRGYGINVTENVWNGNRTINSIRQAESGVLGAREQLRNTEQNVLLTAVTYYMDVLQNTAILDLDRNNVEVLQEQLRQTQDRFNVGEVTRTDVAQAEASLAGARATALTAQSNLQTSVANYRKEIGDEPRSLSPVAPVSKQLPRTLSDAVAISQVEHPAIVAMLHGVDAAALAIKISEGALYPTVGLTGSVNKRFDVTGFPNGNQALTGLVMAQVTVPIYDGGLTYATTRQAKEQLGQQELQTDLQRDNVRAFVVSAWGLNQNSLGILRAAKAQVQAAEVALAGVREEAKVGQRTTLDVLNAQQTLLNARVQLVIAEHDQVVNSYNLLSSIGRLSIRTLGVAVAEYDPRVHFDQVKNKWIGLRTPDGK